MKNEPILSVKNLTVVYGGNTVVDNVSFDICAGEYVGLVGPNGAGKSTLLKAILGIIKPTSGTIVLPDKISLGYVPQENLANTYVAVSVAEVLQMGFERLSFWQPGGERKEMLRVLDAVGLDESFLVKDIAALSGGQKQRVYVARSLIHHPKILFFDEPLSGVDYTTKLRIYDLLAKLNEKLGITILFVSHEIDYVISNCKRILCINKTLHEGCHPLPFMRGEIKECQLPHLKDGLVPIHHHCH